MRMAHGWLVSLLASYGLLAAACGDSSPTTGGGGTGGTGGDGATAAAGGEGATGGIGAQGGTGGTGGSGATGGGGSPPTNEDCDSAALVMLNLNEDVSFNIPITDMTGNDLSSLCVPDPDTLGDYVYELVIPETCTLTIETTGMGNTEFGLRTDCLTADASCVNNNPTGAERVSFEQGPGTIFLVVQGEPGDYDLNISCNTPACGDSVINTGEECDFGDTVNGDGCDQNCIIEDADPTVENCAAAEGGAAITLQAGETFIPGMIPFASTIAATHDHFGSCQLTPNAAMGESYAPDHVYRIRSAVNGTLTATLGNGLDGVPLCGADMMQDPPFPYPNGCWDRSLYARTGDCDTGTELDCSENPNFFHVTETITFPVTTNTDYFVFVDGWLSSAGFDNFEKGAYTLQFNIVAN